MKDEIYYYYIFDLIKRQSRTDHIPKHTLEDVIEHFKKREEFEKCAYLFEILKTKT